MFSNNVNALKELQERRAKLLYSIVHCTPEEREMLYKELKNLDYRIGKTEVEKIH